MKTRIHYYNYNTRDPLQKAEYEALQKYLLNTPGRGKMLNTIETGDSKRLGDHNTSVEITLDTTNPYSNQWGSSIGRVFDWFQSSDPQIKGYFRGHYLDITEKMIELRHRMARCSYCGVVAPYVSDTMHTECFSSPFMEEDNFLLARLRRIEDSDKPLPQLSEALYAQYHPLYVAAQTRIKGDRIAAIRKDVRTRVAAKILEARTEEAGFEWLLDQGINVENCIFYPHLLQFGFGWRCPLSETVKAELTTQLEGFPFQYALR